MHRNIYRRRHPYKEISVIPSGSSAKWRPGSLTLATDLSQHEPHEVSEAAARQEFHRLLIEALQRHASGTQIIAELSGGMVIHGIWRLQQFGPEASYPRASLPISILQTKQMRDGLHNMLLSRLTYRGIT